MQQGFGAPKTAGFVLRGLYPPAELLQYRRRRSTCQKRSGKLDQEGRWAMEALCELRWRKGRQPLCKALRRRIERDLGSHRGCPERLPSSLWQGGEFCGRCCGETIHNRKVFRGPVTGGMVSRPARCSPGWGCRWTVDRRNHAHLETSLTVVDGWFP